VEDVRLNKESLKLIKALAGNDSVKALMIKQGIAPVIKDLLQYHLVCSF